MKRRSTLLLATMVLGVLMFSGVALAATITGTAGPDNLTGTEEPDTIYAYGGDDVIRAADGTADTIRCGGGYDTAYVDEGLDTTRRCENVRPVAVELEPPGDSVTGAGDNSNVCSNPTTQPSLSTTQPIPSSTTDTDEFEQADLSPTWETTCDQVVNQAAAASG